ncbi:SGNH/GDSL hydrolase family protein [Amaricoccus macauensis]|uniref:SGNH/GDSL hydrolase family protein n=1 Tax=Amaricoccus macauensis TaxID=57001 RepID=UPI003C7CAE87
MHEDLGFEEIVWFGDSLTDERNIHDLTERTTIVTLPAESAGYTEAFTNGDVHAVTTSSLLGVERANYAVAYGHALGSYSVEDYAEDRFGGQIDGVDVFLPGATQEDLDYDLYLGGQVERYLDDTGSEGASDDTAAAFLIGLNDYSEFEATNDFTAPFEAAALVTGVVGATVQAAQAVIETGVETILFYTMPSFRFFPLSAGQSEDLLALGDQLIARHNTALSQGAAYLESTTDADVTFIDFNRLAREIMDDPETFGLRGELFSQPIILGTGGNGTLIELDDGSYDVAFPQNPAVDGIDPDQLPFIDFIHPTAPVHDALGVFTALSLTSKIRLEGSGGDEINGTGCPDLVLSGTGKDRIKTKAGDDVVLAGRNDDEVLAGDGDDIVSGGSGDDVLRGEKGKDVLADGAGDDDVSGGRGKDLLIDGNGFDMLCGGKGQDAFLFVDIAYRVGDTENAGGVMKGGRGQDTVYLVLQDETRALVEAEIVDGKNTQSLDSIGLTTKGIEAYEFLDEVEDLAALLPDLRVPEAELWGLV